ncbi:uncharacterized protein LOC117116849 isoform X2 [Anneissia japonica]|uniref:uncharacterized protein LOC117116849 isoform X2 n=1 Tax=Anneissia japonica TaxID=1529436 RepID=UPI0014259B3A|nr:uncharacterized protein LOC117116849 isoform X2 [Anneissia japonica]
MSHMYEKVVSVLSARPSVRKENDINVLVPWFQVRSDLFKKLQKETLKDIIRNCEFREYESDHLIIRQGDEGHSFYIILRGTVSIYIRYTNDEDSDDGESPKADTKSSESKERDRPTITSEATGVRPKLNRKVYGSYIRTLDGAGLSFGELALIKKSNTRNASVISDSKMHVIIVNRDVYSRSLKISQQKDLEERTNFVDTYPLFRDWRPRYRSMLAMSLRRATIEFNNNIVRQGAPLTNLYFILSGLAIMSTDISLHRKQYKDKLDVGIDIRPPPNRRFMKKVTNTAVRSVYGAANRFDLCVVGQGDIAGDIEAVLRLPTHMQSIRCIERVEVYELDMKYYEKLIYRKNQSTLNIMEHLAAIKIEHRLSRIPRDADALMFEWASEKLREKNMNDKMPIQEETPSNKSNLWMTEKGPLLDPTGPGSLLYHLRKLEKQLARKRRQRRERAAKSETDFQIQRLRPTLKPSEELGKPFVSEKSYPSVEQKQDQLKLGLNSMTLSFLNLQTNLDLELPSIPLRPAPNSLHHPRPEKGKLRPTLQSQAVKNIDELSVVTDHSHTSHVSETLPGLIGPDTTTQHQSLPVGMDSSMDSSEEVLNQADNRLSESFDATNLSNPWEDDQKTELKLLSSLRRPNSSTTSLDESASSFSASIMCGNISNRSIDEPSTKPMGSIGSHPATDFLGFTERNSAVFELIFFVSGTIVIIIINTQ